MKITSRRTKSLAAVIFVLAVFGSGQTAFADFSGDFAPEKWSYSETATGPSGTLNSTTMTLTSANNAGGLKTGQYSIVIPNGTQQISFTFTYITNDESPYYDPSKYVLDGTPTNLSLHNGPNNQSGTITLDVSAKIGKTFSISQTATDSVGGAATTTITNFNAVKSYDRADVLVESRKPNLLAGSKQLICTPGSFDMLRGGFSREAGKPTSIVYTLIVDGKRVSSVSSDNWKGLSKAFYDTSNGSVRGMGSEFSAIWDIDIDAYSLALGSAYCEVLAYQDGSVAVSNSNRF